MVKISPSILSADLTQLGAEIRKLEKYVDMFHIDVMDGHFVPNITYGPIIMEAVRRTTRLPLEADLMISNPAQYVAQFAEAGADVITIHPEADIHVHRTLTKIRKHGAKAGISLNPSTPLSVIEQFLDKVDHLLIMTVNPGFAGQKFIPTMLKKITAAKRMIRAHNLKIPIEVDGGINAETAGKAVRAGADILVSGSYIYGSKDVRRAISKLKEIN